MVNLSPFVVAFIAASLVSVAAGSNQLVDENVLDPSAGSDLCQHENKRISHISSIGKLIDQIDSSEDSDCRQRWLEPLQDLKEVLDASEKDACSYETVSLIHKFHWYYTAGTLSRKWRQAVEGPIPEPLRVFFLHFADEVAERCKDNLSRRLSEAIGSLKVSPESLTEGSFGTMIDSLSIALVARKNVKKYDDFFLIFNSMIDMEKKKGRYIAEEIDPNTGETFYVSIKVKDSQKPFMIQQQCRKDLRPVYHSTVLPVMLLIDMGFGKKGKGVHSEEISIKNWYAITQMCELILPIRFYDSNELKEGQVSVVIDEESKDTLEQPTNHVFKDQLPADATTTPVELVDIIDSARNDEIVKRIKSNMKNRSKFYFRAYKNFILTVKSELKSKVKNIFFSKKTSDNKFVLEKGETTYMDTLNEVDRMLEKNEKEDNEEEDESIKMNQLVRHKRYSEKRPRLIGEKSTRHKLFDLALSAVYIGVFCSMIFLIVYACMHGHG